jgi:hypothetical protein
MVARKSSIEVGIRGGWERLFRVVGKRGKGNTLIRRCSMEPCGGRRAIGPRLQLPRDSERAICRGRVRAHPLFCVFGISGESAIVPAWLTPD